MNNVTKYVAGVSTIVAIAALIAYAVGYDVAVVWAAITTTTSLWALKKQYGILRVQLANSPRGDFAMAAGMTAGVFTTAFIYIVTPLAFGGIVGVAVSAAMQAVIGYKTAVENMK